METASLLIQKVGVVLSGTASKAMRIDKAFGISSFFGKLNRESRKSKVEYFGTFSYRPSLSTGVPFRKFLDFFEVTENVIKYSVYFLTNFWSGTTV